MRWSRILLPAITAGIRLVDGAPFPTNNLALVHGIDLPGRASSGLFDSRTIPRGLTFANDVVQLEPRKNDDKGKGKGKGKGDEDLRINIDMWDLAFIQPAGQESIYYKHKEDGSGYQQVKHKKGKFVIETKGLATCHALVVTAEKGALMTHFPPQVCEYLDDQTPQRKPKAPNSVNAGDEDRKELVESAIKQLKEVLQQKKSMLTGKDEQIYLVHGPVKTKGQTKEMGQTVKHLSEILKQAGYDTSTIKETTAKSVDQLGTKAGKKGFDSGQARKLYDLYSTASVSHIGDKFLLLVGDKPIPKFGEPDDSSADEDNGGQGGAGAGTSGSRTGAGGSGGGAGSS